MSSVEVEKRYGGVLVRGYWLRDTWGYWVGILVCGFGSFSKKEIGATNIEEILVKESGFCSIWVGLGLTGGQSVRFGEEALFRLKKYMKMLRELTGN